MRLHSHHGLIHSHSPQLCVLQEENQKEEQTFLVVFKLNVISIYMNLRGGRKTTSNESEGPTTSGLCFHLQPSALRGFSSASLPVPFQLVIPAGLWRIVLSKDAAEVYPPWRGAAAAARSDPRSHRVWLDQQRISSLVFTHRGRTTCYVNSN